MKFATAVVAVFTMCMANVAFAADDHKGHAHDEKKGQAHAHDAQPQYGGVVTVVKDINYELVAKADAITLYVTDHGLPMDTKDASATVALLSAADKSEVKLTPVGADKLQAQGTFKLQPGTKAVALVKLGDKSSQNVRFVLK